MMAAFHICRTDALYAFTLKHANAKSVEIHLSLIDNELSLLFEDNGKGFESI